MSEKQPKRSKRIAAIKNTNLWKWAFLILTGILIGALFWIYQQVQPVQIGEENLDPVVQEEQELTFEVRAGREQVAQVINTYLEEEMAEEFVGFTFALEEQAELHGEIEVFGFPIEFSLFMAPYVLENGNLQLRGESLNIGSLNLPISFAMSQIGRQLNFPDWIAINSEEERVVVNLNEFELENGVQFSFNRIDLLEDDIVINIHLPQEAIQ